MHSVTKISYVTLGKSFNLYESREKLRKNEDNNLCLPHVVGTK